MMNERMSECVNIKYSLIHSFAHSQLNHSLINPFQREHKCELQGDFFEIIEAA
jgi:hypothetical protein